MSNQQNQQSQPNIEERYKNAMYHLSCLAIYVEQGAPDDYPYTLQHTKQFLEKEKSLTTTGETNGH